MPSFQYASKKYLSFSNEVIKNVLTLFTHIYFNTFFFNDVLNVDDVYVLRQCSEYIFIASFDKGRYFCSHTENWANFYLTAISDGAAKSLLVKVMGIHG